ncbi:gtp-binding protein [Stylonychia lemnae]|uniref:Gtp-binding protein n=1 Tax=Stylonychia lemnae TaxID=5949 RepID=A0A078APY4_STYLE|nr:gtp-binding protein [Stylonychia lemnae]|eukprot:CDW84229.1 gtp-binding protein [Stylonychia lemnae]
MSQKSNSNLSHKNFSKILIIGDSGVGKSSLLQTFNLLKESQKAKPTVGAEFYSKQLTLQEFPSSLYKGQEVHLQIWDTAGQERFQSLCTAFYRGTDCCVIVFDLSDLATYSNVEKWVSTFQQVMGDDIKHDIPIILVGNKSDKERLIDSQTINEYWVDSGKAKIYIESSAHNKDGVENIFYGAGFYSHEYQLMRKRQSMERKASGSPRGKIQVQKRDSFRTSNRRESNLILERHSKTKYGASKCSC